jgi:hypothetical protein
MTSPKYPRISHLPWSPGGTSDDRRLPDVSSLLKVKVTITEKLDGSNVCLERDGVYARSHNQAPDHPSFDLLKAFHASVRSRIPDGLQIFGEWLYAKLSIHYQGLPSYLMVFGVRNLDSLFWLSWEDVELWAEELGVPTVPVLYSQKMSFRTVEQLKAYTEYAATSNSGGGGPVLEGLVVRQTLEFPDEDFSRAVAKWVRKNHVQADDHWRTQPIVRNLLRPGTASFFG